MTTEPPESERPTLPGENTTVYASGIRLGPDPPEAVHPRSPSGWQLAAVVSWVLVLAVLGVLTARFGPLLAWGICALQLLLIAGVFMRVAWDRPVNWIFGLVALLLVGMRGGLLMLDRTEYQPEVDRFESTPLDPSHATLPAAD
jgi:hypothetical protein